MNRDTLVVAQRPAAPWSLSHSLSTPVYLALLASTLAIIIGLRIPQPLHGDLALFLTFVKGMDQGQALYRDIWDIKPPGIFAFYFAAGKVFGFTDVGMRLFEALYQVSMGLLIMVIVKPWFPDDRVRYALPAIYCAAYYAVSTSWILGQVEPIISPLLAISALSVARVARLGPGVGPARTWPWAVVSGLAVGLACLFKPVFAILPVVVWLTLGARWWRAGALMAFVPACALAAVVSLFPLLTTGVVFHQAGLLELLIEQLFVEPLIVTAHMGPNWRHLEISLMWLARFAPAMLATCCVIWLSRRADRDHALLVTVVSWIAGCALVVGVQVQSWWVYHFTLFLLPFSVLVALALQGALADPKKRFRGVAAGVVLGLWFAPWTPLANAALTTLKMGGPPTSLEEKLEYQIRLGDPKAPMEALLEDARPLREQADAPTEVFVFGHPGIYVLTDTLQGLRRHGWTPEYYIEEMWDELAADFREAKLSHVFISDFYPNIIRAEHPDLMDAIENRYQLLSKTRDGAWYVRKPPETASAP